MVKKRSKRKSKPIISGYLEKISARIFDDFSSIVTDMIKGHQGIYALYKTNKLYYVGLATELKARIKYHLKDKHQGKWSRFSLYIIRKSDHIKEMESLVLCIAYPVGNAVKGKLKSSENLLPKLKSKIKIEQNRQIADIIGKGKMAVNKKKRRSIKRTAPQKRPLYNIFPKGKVIYANYKGDRYKAWVCGNGRIKYNGQYYDSPSAIGADVRGGKSTNGWSFWKYKDKGGKLVKISDLRK